uniref:SBP-type domain-containing protein n=1 Tax=Tetraselmis sp. GSL018 TaxID=582737 RepID=A0A061QPH2_9CHLO|mmetsp:Transcript_38217/g.90704  ORF Transcript_38217/g.90704 Transcript_38217/m.90704 type:complete len:447 (+) Transcript_38217:461-1801(+)
MSERKRTAELPPSPVSEQAGVASVPRAVQQKRTKNDTASPVVTTYPDFKHGNSIYSSDRYIQKELELQYRLARARDMLADRCGTEHIPVNYFHGLPHRSSRVVLAGQGLQQDFSSDRKGTSQVESDKYRAVSRTTDSPENFPAHSSAVVGGSTAPGEVSDWLLRNALALRQQSSTGSSAFLFPQRMSRDSENYLSSYRRDDQPRTCSVPSMEHSAGGAASLDKPGPFSSIGLQEQAAAYIREAKAALLSSGQLSPTNSLVYRLLVSASGFLDESLQLSGYGLVSRGRTSSLQTDEADPGPSQASIQPSSVEAPLSNPQGNPSHSPADSAEFVSPPSQNSDLCEESGRDDADRKPPKLFHCHVCGTAVRSDAVNSYRRRRRVCTTCFKAWVCYQDGKPVRFCQSCSRAHDIADFDEGRRSCREELRKHASRRREQRRAGRVSEQGDN